MGIRPLYYFETDNSLIFSSDIPSLLCCVNENEHKVNPECFSIYFNFNCICDQSTFFDNIKKLDGGHYIMVHCNICINRTYWDLDPQHIEFIPDIFDSMKNLGELIDNSVKSNIPDDDVINIFLSGGIDSSIIVDTVHRLIENKEISAKEIRTYTVGFDTNNEFDYANIVANKYHTTHHNILTNTDEYIESMIDLIQFKGCPLNSFYEPLIYVMSNNVKEKGYNVVLTGVGADELFYGYEKAFSSYYEYMRDSSEPLTEYMSKILSNVPNKIIENIVSKNVWDKYFQTDKTIVNYFNNILKKCEYDTHFQSKIDLVLFGLIQRTLMSFDNATMLASVECRHPFLNNDLLEYSFYRISNEHKFKTNASISQLVYGQQNMNNDKIFTPKYIEKELYANKIPIDVIARKKNDFEIPIERVIDEKYETIIKILDSGYINNLKLFDFTNIIARFKSHNIDKNDIYLLWCIVNLEIFTQLYMFNISIDSVKEFFLVNQQYRSEKEKLLTLIIPTQDNNIQRYIKLFVIISILRKFKIEYFAVSNLMLGCVRHKGFIPWDDHVDLTIMHDQCCKMTIDLKYDLLYAGFQLKKTNEGYTITDYLDEEDFCVTIFIGNYENDEQLKIIYDESKSIYKSELYPLVDYNFGSYTIIGIGQPHEYLLRCGFGDYMKSDYIKHLRNIRKNDILFEFLQKNNLDAILIRDVAMLTYTDHVPVTDDWMQYFIRAKDMIPHDFNYNTYLLLNKDLDPKKYNEPTDLFVHYIKQGKKEGRKYIFDLPLDFDVMGYRCLNPELLDVYKTDKELCAHYMTLGSKQNKKYNIKSILPNDFDVETYAYLNEDLDNFNNDECKLINHYVMIGKSEGRFYTIDRIIPKDFDYAKYIAINSDLQKNGINTKRKAITHYTKFGRQQNRKYK